ncbi:MAG: cysteine desulfurase family protein [Oscillospiraceae bacterium]
MIYLDYAAHTAADKLVTEAFCGADWIGNPNSAHVAGRAAKHAIDAATAEIATLLGAKPNEIIHTSGASEANNTAIKGFIRAGRHTGKHIISSVLEHSSVSGVLSRLQEQGCEVELVRITSDGKIDLAHLAELLRQDTVLVTVSAVDSELGSIQPVEEITQLIKAYPDCRLHVDATQAIGKLAFDCAGADSVSFSAHKFYGITGAGVLFLRENRIIEPLIHGGASTTLYRSGTPAVALAVSTAKALSLAVNNQSARTTAVEALARTLRGRLAGYKNVRFNSPADGVPHILNLSVAGIKGADFQKKLDERGVCVSVKSACSAEQTPSRAVFAVSHDRKNALCSWRISLSHLTGADELEEFMIQFDQIYKELYPHA